MKRTHRILAIALVLVILFAEGNLAALAEGVLTMPTALQIIDEESFYGASSIDKVVLSNKVTEIRARAFANSTLSEINLPASLTYIAEDAFDGPDKVIVTAIEGTYAYDWAVDHGYISPDLTIRSLSSNVSQANIGDLITWTATVQGGTKEYRYQYTVYNGKNIVIATGYSDSASFSYAPASVGQYYVRVTVDDGEDSINLKTENAVTVTKTDLRITSINASAESTIPGDTVYWTVKTVGGESGLTFNYMLKRDGVLVDALSNTKNNFFSAVLDEKGTYILSATVTDKNGASAEGQSVPAIVGNSPVKIAEITFDSAVPVVAGEKLIWTVSAEEGEAPYSYAYTLRDQTGEVDSETGESNVFRYAGTMENHVYTLTVVCTDASGKEAQASAAPVQVYAAENVIAAPPMVEMSEAAFAESEADATVISAQSLFLSVENAENARQYTLTLDAKKNGQWTNLWQQTFDASKTQCTIPETVFAGITEQTLCRLTASASALRTGESKAYYFQVKPSTVDYTMLVDGKNTVIWYRSLCEEGERTFAITSAQPWTVSEKPDWVTVIEGPNTLTVRVSYNPSKVNRNGSVIIANQGQTVRIGIAQGYGSGAPELSVSNTALSTDPSHPTEIPYGGFLVNISDKGHNYHYLQVAEKVSGSYVEKADEVNYYSKYEFTPVWNGLTFTAGKEYRITVSGHYTSDFRNYEANSDASPFVSYFDALSSVAYYIRMVNSGHYVSLEGREQMTVTTYNDIDVDLYASNVCSVTSDAGWLTYSTNTSKTGWRLRAKTEPNYTGGDRTGHLTVSCGPKTAVLTVLQPDCTPRLISPANISQNASSPTQLTINVMQVQMVSARYEWAVLENGQYTNLIYNLSGGEIGKDYRVFSEDSDSLKPGKQYRLTLSNADGKTTQYYVKASTHNTTNCIYFTYHSYLSHDPEEVPFEGGKLKIGLHATGQWQLTSSESWCTLSATSGSTSKTITITVTENTSVSERSAVITGKLISTGQMFYFNIHQPGKPAVGAGFKVYLDKAQIQSGYTFQHLSGEKRNLTSIFDIIIFSPESSYTIESLNGWITVDKASYTSGASPKISIQKNDTGSSRQGTVRLTSGSTVFYLYIQQEPFLEKPVITSPQFSTDFENPSIYLYDNGDITVTWKKVNNAASYKLEFSTIKNNKSVINFVDVPDTGAAVYSAVIPQAWMDLTAEEYYSIYLIAYNGYGHESLSEQFITIVPGDTAYLDGSRNPVMENASDFGGSRTFTVTSTAAWQARANDSWIRLDKTSGVSGDQLTVTVMENTGDARNGTVTVSVNGKSTVLNVSQYAFMPKQEPVILSPVLSDRLGNPTILTSAPISITVELETQPQMESYRIYLYETQDNGRLKLIKESRTLKYENSQYNFTDLTLQKSRLYSFLVTSRCERYGRQDRYFYFIISDPSATLDLGWFEEDTLEFEPTRDYLRSQITSSGYWTAQTNDEWIYLAGWKVTEEDLADLDIDPSNPFHGITYYDYGGVSGDYLYITTAPNPGKKRTGTVTVRCGNVEKHITVTQFGQYSIATLNGNYSTDSSTPTEINQAPLTLSWSKAEGGSGEYCVLLKELSENGWRYDRVYKKTTSSRGITIPQSKFEQNKYYKLYLVTILEGNTEEDDNPCQIVYLYVGYGNALSLSAGADWSSAYIGGKVYVTASASGGSGEYLYEYHLYRNGTEVKDSGGMVKFANYDFSIDSAGQYQVKVVVKDVKTGKTVEQICEDGDVSGEVTAQISIDQTNWSPQAAGDTLFVHVTANMNWECRGSDPWITVEKQSDIKAKVTVSANDTGNNRTGRAIFNIGGVGVSVEIAQEPVSTPQDSTLKLTPSVWPISGFIASSTSVLVSSDGDWSITAYPDWVIPSSLTGSRGDRVSFYAGPNPTEETRQGDVVFVCGTATGSFTVIQSANDFQPCVERVEFSKVEVLTGENVTMTVTVRNAVEVQLWVDGNLLTENTATVWGNTATVVRAFSMAGERKIQLRAVREDGVGVFSDEYNLTVTKIDDLKTPVVSAPDDVILGENCIVSWGNVDNATDYTVYLYAGNEQLWKKSVNNKTSIELTKDDLFNINSYTVLVIATADGYSQSQGGAIIKVISREAEQSPFIEYRIGNIAKQTLKKTTESKLLYARTDSTVDSVTVLLKGTEIPLIKDINASTDSEYVFTQTVNPPSEGLNEYNFVATMKNGQTYSGAWSRHWMYTSNETAIIYYTNSENTITYSILGKKQGELPYNYEVDVLGTMLGRAYVKIGGIDSFIDIDNLSLEKPLKEIHIDPSEIRVYVDGNLQPLKADGLTSYYCTGERYTDYADYNQILLQIPAEDYIDDVLLPEVSFVYEDISSNCHPVLSYENGLLTIKISDYGEMGAGYYQVSILTRKDHREALTIKIFVLGYTFDWKYHLNSEFKSVNTEAVNSRIANISAEASDIIYNGDAAIRQFLLNNGFCYGFDSGNFVSKEHSVAYVFATKLVFNENNDIVPLFVLIIRGTYGDPAPFTGKEWASNFTGIGNDWYGFDIPAAEVYELFQQYITNQFFNAKIGSLCTSLDYKVWITGHSRGGAVGNLIAGSYFNWKDRKDVCAYLFAVPNVSKSGTFSKNIKNFVIEADIVPRMPLIDWGYKKYGRVITGSTNYIQKFLDEVSTVPAERIESFFASTFDTEIDYYRTVQNDIRNAILGEEGLSSVVSYLATKYGFVPTVVDSITYHKSFDVHNMSYYKMWIKDSY